MKKYTPIVPALIPEDQAAVTFQAGRLTFASEFQLDLVDGRFVSSVSWPYQPQGQPMMVKSSLDRYTLEVDLMVEKPLSAAEEWLKAGADMLVFHIETVDPDALRRFADQTNVSVGVSLHGNTPLERLDDYLSFADYVQLMGIHEIGAQGQPFDESVLDKIKHLRERDSDLMISIDGSVNQQTIKRLYQAGANRFVCGSAIVLQNDPEAAWQELAVLIND
jgi:ribulose-phosphate 3-epimerase